MIDLSIVLPVHNEEEIIESVFFDIKKTIDKLPVSAEYILVENGSKDKTYQIIKKIAGKYKNIYAITAPKGYGSAVLAGLHYAKGLYLCYMPSDGQIDLSVFSLLWQYTKEDKWDVIKIKRITRESATRMAVSLIFSVIMKIVFGIPFLDVNGSPRIFKKKLFEKLSLRSSDSFIDAEFAIRAKRLGLSIKEVPMKTLDRAGGVSTRSISTFIEFFSNIIRLKLKGTL